MRVTFDGGDISSTTVSVAVELISFSLSEVDADDAVLVFFGAGAQTSFFA